MKAVETPLMKQYGQIKQQHPEAILLFRLGDFYETFGTDAELTAKACGITLTKRNNGSAGEIPLAGFPHHQLDTYLPRLVQAGHRVAVCEQLEDPKQAKGIVRRGVVEIVTPGVILYDKLLHHQRPTFACCLVPPTRTSSDWGIAVLDASTGVFIAGSVSTQALPSVLASYAPAEVIVARSSYDHAQSVLRSQVNQPAITRIDDWHVDLEVAQRTLTTHFGTSTLKGFGLHDDPAGVVAAGTLLWYVSQTQQRTLHQITSLSVMGDQDGMVLDQTTRRTLELVASSTSGEKSGALIEGLDRTHTPMGARLLRWWLQTPLRSLEAITDRLDHVAAFVNDSDVMEGLKSELSLIADLERLSARIAAERSTARDLAVLRRSLARLPNVQRLLLESDHVVLQELGRRIRLHDDIVQELSQSLVEEPPVQVGTGTMFQPGYDTELDTVSQAMLHGKTWIKEYQDRQRLETGIATLKIATNNVFGYYIEVSRLQSSRVPESYQRRQTLANAERFTTIELANLEQSIVTASTRLAQREQELLVELRRKVSQQCAVLQQTSQVVAAIDAMVSFAAVAVEYGYVRPEVHDGRDLQIIDGRHPVLERVLPVGVPYVPNSLRMDADQQRVHIITGPNMSGKSSYLRQTGIIVLLAHVGSFVPARSARIPLTDRIFTRVGAHDNLMAGESTFLVEMQEAASILHNATDRSLILLDEVGRGTATFDGMSIAWAIAVHLHDVVRAKTLFATHYHELATLASIYPHIANYQVEVREEQAEVIFTHRVVPGHTDHSFGLHVARMAGVPAQVIHTAESVLRQLEKGSHTPSTQVVNSSSTSDPLRERLSGLQVDRMTPIEALAYLAELQGLANEQ